MNNEKELFEEAIKYKEFTKIVKDNKLNYECLKNILNFDAVATFINSQKIDCSKSGSLNDCLQDIKGKKISLFFRNNLFYCLSKNCEHQTKYEEITGWKKNFVHKNFSWELIEEIDKKKVPGLYKQAIDKAKDIISGKSKKSLFISGNDSFANNVFLKTIAYKISKSKTKDHLYDKKIYFDNFTNILNDIKDSFSENSKNINTLTKIKSVDILFIDCLGSETPTQWSVDEVLLSIISHRAENKLLTFVSSKFTISELCKYYEKVLKQYQNSKIKVSNSDFKKLLSYFKALFIDVKISKE